MPTKYAVPPTVFLGLALFLGVATVCAAPLNAPHPGTSSSNALPDTTRGHDGEEGPEGTLSGNALSEPTGAVASAHFAEEGTLLFTQNLAQGRVLFIDPNDDTRVVDFQIGEALPQCAYPNGDPSCFMIGGHHTVYNDRDFVEFAASHLISQRGTIARVSLADKRPVWSLERLDFTGVPGPNRCKQACDDPAKVDPDCLMWWNHEFIIADENPREEWIELITAEMGHQRVVKVRFDYSEGGRCGEVQWVLDDDNPEWFDTYAQPNGVQLLHEPEGDFLMVTLLTEDIDIPGHARIYLYDVTDGDPKKVWGYPGDDAGALSYTNATHHGLIETDPVTGSRYLLYGHSLGDSDEWNAGTGGAWGIARVGDDIRDLPQYMGEWVLPASADPLLFTRELEILDDGTFLGVDAGCYWLTDPDQPCPAQVYWFKPELLPSSELSGYYDPNHASQNIVELSEAEVLKEVNCGLHLLFEADVVPPSAQGRDLRAAREAGGSDCSLY